MVLQGTKLSFDLEVLSDVSANDTNRTRKSYPCIYLRISAKAGLVSVLHSHTQNLNAVCDMIGGSIPSW